MQYPKIFHILDIDGKKLGDTIQKDIDAAKADAQNRFSGKWHEVIDTGLVKPPNKCCNKCGDKPCH